MQFFLHTVQVQKQYKDMQSYTESEKKHFFSLNTSLHHYNDFILDDIPFQLSFCSIDMSWISKVQTEAQELLSILHDRWNKWNN